MNQCIRHTDPFFDTDSGGGSAFSSGIAAICQ
jgi:hypothetical protein